MKKIKMGKKYSDLEFNYKIGDSICFFFRTDALFYPLICEGTVSKIGIEKVKLEKDKMKDCIVYYIDYINPLNGKVSMVQNTRIAVDGKLERIIEKKDKKEMDKFNKKMAKLNLEVVDYMNRTQKDRYNSSLKKAKKLNKGKK